MKTATTIQENAEDIYAEAQQINEDRAAQAAKSMMVKQKQQRLQQKNDPFMKAGINYEICDQT